MPRELTTQNATITTAAVEVKALTISGKQVTLAVFRQLQEEPLVDWDRHELRGIPWGFVNYCPQKFCIGDQYGEPVPHWHVVWQRGQELRRATVRRQLYTGWEIWRNGERDAEEADRRNELISSLSGLPQLFIAV